MREGTDEEHVTDARGSAPVYPALDAWRGVAVLWVLLFHLDKSYSLHIWDAGHRLHP